MKTCEMINLMHTCQQSAYVEWFKPHVHVLMMQMSIRVGIKKFGEKGNEALMKELQQPHDRMAMVPKERTN